MPRTGRPKAFEAAKLVKLPAELLADVQAYRKAHDLASDSEAIRQLIARGLEAEAGRPRKARAKPTPAP